RDGVIEQAVAVGLVVVLGRGRVPEALPHRRIGSKEAVEQSGQLRILDRGEELSKLRLEALDRHARPLSEICGIELAVARGTDGLDRDLAAVLGVHGEAARDVDGRTGRRGLEELGDAIPRDRLDRTRAAADHQAQPVFAVSPLAKLALADAEHARDLLAVGEIAYP